MICPYFLTVEDKLDHSHFLMFPESGNWKQSRKRRLRKLLERLETPNTLINSLVIGMKYTYCNHKEKRLRILSTDLIENQHQIQWEHFIRGRVSKMLTQFMTYHYSSKPSINRGFSGIGWTKEIIEFLLELHHNELKYRCE